MRGVLARRIAVAGVTVGVLAGGAAYAVSRQAADPPPGNGLPVEIGVDAGRPAPGDGGGRPDGGPSSSAIPSPTSWSRTGDDGNGARDTGAPVAPVRGGTGGGSGGADVHRFAVNADTVPGLYPGAARAVTVTVTNPYHFDIRLTALSAALDATSAPACQAGPANLTVGALRAGPGLPLVVPAGRPVRVGDVPLSMPNTVADACQGATFTIRLAATATKARP
jgi:hypothetical protein